MNEFVNPYNHVPSPPRHDLPAAQRESLGDHPGAALDRLHPGRYSGVLQLELTAHSPVVSLDPHSARPVGNEGHFVYDPAMHGDWERPRLELTQIKGMLRDAFETVTNSRYGVFEGHGERLGRRMAATESQRMVPVRCLEDGSLEVLAGTVPKGQQQANDGLMHAAFVPMYAGAPLIAGRPTMNSNTGDVTPPIGSRVWAWVERVQHFRGHRNNPGHVRDFQCWRVLELSVSAPGLSPTAPPSFGAPPQVDHQNCWQATGEAPRRISGWFHCTNRNIKRKHDERLFFHALSDDPEMIVGDDAQRLHAHYRDVVASYRGAHTRAELFERSNAEGPHSYLGGQPGKTAWSRHQYMAGEEQLRPGMLAYARWNGAAWDGLFPVAIARELYESAPAALLAPDGLAPARTLHELSPADRLFGWVSQQGGATDEAALRGRCRVQAVDTSQAQLERFAEPLSLAILGQPRPQQGRFSTTLRAERGAAPGRIPDGRPSAQLFRDDAALHRKRFVTHAMLPANHWEDPTAERSQQHQNGVFREYRRPSQGVEQGSAVQLTVNGPGGATRFALAQPHALNNDNQNRSITGWIAKGSRIGVQLRLTDVTLFELGALLWLVTLPEEHRVGLGLAKPFGLGSVHVALDAAGSRIYDNAVLIESMQGFSLEPLGPGQDLTSAGGAGVRAIEHFKEEVAVAYGTVAAPASLEERFVSAPFIKEYLAITRGNPTVPVHYPRVRPQGMAAGAPVPPNPFGRNYEWFVANEKALPGRQRSLPLMSEGGALPVHPAG